MAEIEMDTFNDQMGMQPMAMQPMMAMGTPMMAMPAMAPMQQTAQAPVQEAQPMVVSSRIPVPLQVQPSGLLVHHVPVSDNESLSYGSDSQVVYCKECNHIIYTDTRISCCSVCCYYFIIWAIVAFTLGLSWYVLLTYCARHRMLITVHRCPICLKELGRSERSCTDKED